MDQSLVGDLVRGVGYGVLKLATAGTYRSGDNGVLLEGCTGLLILAALFFFSYKFLS